MESFEEILTAGGHSNSLGRAGEVLDTVRGDTSRLDELFSCISADDAWVRMRAIDTFEKLVKDKPEVVQPYLPTIFSNLTKSSQASIQWHLAQIFSEVEFTTKQRSAAIAWLKNAVMTTNVDWIVSVNVMKALLYFHQNGFIAANDIAPLYKVQEGHVSKSVRKKAASFLAALQ